MSINIHSSDDEIRKYLLSPDDNTPTEPQPQQNTGSKQTASQSQPVKQQTTNEGTSQQEGNPPYVRRYSHHSCAELCKRREPIPHLIKGYMRQRGLGMIYGESGCGKSFTVIDMAASIACNDITTWNGKSIHHGPVVYFAGEGADGLNARLACWCNEHNVDPENVQLEVIDETFKLDCGKDDPTHNIENTIAEIKATFPKPALVVFDTLNVYMEAEENSNTEAGNFCALCRRIIQECGCTVLIIHHTGLNPDAKKRARGASALKGAMDFILQLNKSGDILTLSTPKIKDGKEQPELTFNLRQHEIPEWFDEDGEPVTSCTIELATALMQSREAKKKEKQEKPLKKLAIKARNTYTEAIKRAGRIIKDENTGHEIAAVDLEDWRKTAYAMSSADNENTKRGQFRDQRENLLEIERLLTKKIIEGREYYCLDLNGNADELFIAGVRIAAFDGETERGATTKPPEAGNDKGEGATDDITPGLF